jgi:hypothetical protein
MLILIKTRRKKKAILDAHILEWLGNLIVNDALILTLDHKNPTSNELVVSLNIINKMKADIPFDDFKSVVITLGEYFKEENDTNFKKLEKELKQKFG